MRWNHVALLAEGVDRNFALYRAGPATAVALLAEGVDRNCLVTGQMRMRHRRPPRGGRG